MCGPLRVGPLSAFNARRARAPSGGQGEGRASTGPPARPVPDPLAPECIVSVDIWGYLELSLISARSPRDRACWPSGGGKGYPKGQSPELNHRRHSNMVDLGLHGGAPRVSTKADAHPRERSDGMLRRACRPEAGETLRTLPDMMVLSLHTLYTEERAHIVGVVVYILTCCTSACRYEPSDQA